ncbi:hypothetical protein LIER_17478 [Lithospermum erythrorhizon]|uniref:Uncharacterized protein n=1 Tax=Lithospermum erythrorhizon TaxID=34254 RepID=A0AAV3QAH1_LITER
MMKSFLWKRVSSGKFLPKASWKQATLKKEEGKEALWVRWINTVRLKGQSFWGIASKSTDSWTWRKLLQLRELLKSHVKYYVGNGESINCMFDNWSTNGVIAEYLSARSSSVLQMLRIDFVAGFMAKREKAHSRYCHVSEQLHRTAAVWDCMRSQGRRGGGRFLGSRRMSPSSVLLAGCCAWEGYQLKTGCLAGVL